MQNFKHNIQTIFFKRSPVKSQMDLEEICYFPRNVSSNRALTVNVNYSIEL
jgi:hypothetical protein